LDFWGLETTEALIGKTIYDLRRKTFWTSAQEKFTEEIWLTDKDIANQSSIKWIKAPDEYLNAEGYIVNHSMIKIPVFDSDKHVKAILTFTFDSTRLTDPETLLRIYQTAYKDQPQLGDQKFLEYMGLSALHKKSLTHRELECLVLLSKHRHLKTTAQSLNLRTDTLKSHLSHIRLKLNCKNLMTILKHFSSTHHRKF
jgi:DNA-binding CsgD family transcriptional regulator